MPRASRLGGEGARWLWVSDPSHLSNLTQKGDAEMYKVCRRKVVRDPARGRPRRPPRAAGERKAEGIGQGRGGEVAGLRREGEPGRRRQREAGEGGGFPSRPDSSSPGPERKGRAAITIWGQDPGALRFRFHPMCSICMSLAFPGPSPRPGGRDRVRVWAQDRRLDSPPSGAHAGARRFAPLPRRGLERASPGPGWARGEDAQRDRKRGRWARRGQGSPRLPPSSQD